MENQAAANAMKGLSTRIPFLKNALCGQETLSGESVRSEPRSLEKIVPEGHLFGLKADKCLALFRLKPFWDDLARFNSFNARLGLQAVAVEKPSNNHIHFRVSACDISYLGDLRIARVLGDESGLHLAGGGAYNSVLYGVFLRKNQEFYPHQFVMVHELEHAQHHSLWNLAGFPFLAFDTECAEYLAMLRTLIDLGEAPQLTVWRNEFISLLPANTKNAGNGDSIPHDEAAIFFVKRLTGRYRMSRQDVAMGIAWTFREELQARYGQTLDSTCAEQFIRMRNAAIGEYNEAYRKLFGMQLDDLRDVVSRLSL
jgi:hypothetical protein